ncbi:MAG TPA: hypothetical protein EYQ00_03805 [Dehalococcoidia bacterium]|jgi:hypothetical protein|nr:hypothetical protein [Dehalococcoidia bacterium]
MPKITTKEFSEMLKQAMNRGLDRGKSMGIDPERGVDKQQPSEPEEIENYVEQKVVNIFDDEEDEALVKSIKGMYEDDTPYTDDEVIIDLEKFFKNELKGRSPQMALIWAKKTIKRNDERKS